MQEDELETVQEAKSEKIDYSISGKLLSQAHTLNSRMFSRMFSANPYIKITSEQSKILWYLWEKDCMTTTDLSIATGLAKNTLSVALDNLEKAGFVEKRDCTQDKRKKYYSATPLGTSQRELSHRISESIGEVFYTGFNAAERKQFESYLARIVTNLQNVDFAQLPTVHNDPSHDSHTDKKLTTSSSKEDKTSRVLARVLGRDAKND